MKMLFKHLKYGDCFSFVGEESIYIYCSSNPFDQNQSNFLVCIRSRSQRLGISILIDSDEYDNETVVIRQIFA